MRKQPRKLSLSVETLWNLDRNHLKDAAGGSLGATNCATCDSGAHVCSGCLPCF